MKSYMESYMERKMTNRMSKAAGVLAVAITFFMIGSAVAHKQGLSKTTMENLSTAMHGEAFAYAKYLLYAEHARQSGNEELAKLFESAAKTERFDHFSKQAQLAGVVGSDADNLKSAIQGESYEVDNMYREFAAKATAAGDREAADLFNEIRNDERKHRDAFKAELDKLGKTPASK